MFAHGRLKLQTRDQLQNLTENTAYSVHGGISVRWYWFSTINPTYRRFHLAALAAQSLTLGGSHLIWTRVVCARIKEELLKEFNLHTIVRLPNGVFAPYTSIPTNLLFFDRSGPTKEIWYYEQPLPEGRKN